MTAKNSAALNVFSIKKEVLVSQLTKKKQF